MKHKPLGSRVSVVSLLDSGIVVSLEIPESSSHSWFPYPGFFLVKIDFFIVKSIPGAPGKPGEAIRTRGNLKMTTFFRPKNANFLRTMIFHFFLKCSRRLRVNFEIWQQKPHLRYWFSQLHSTFRSKPGCDRLPSKFSRFSTPLQYMCKMENHGA